MSELIYIAEDDVEINELITLHLRNEGYRVEQAYDGEDVLMKCREERPSLLILDLMMPKMDGFQVIKEVRKRWKVPIMLLTARADDADKVLGFGLGADDYVVKPFSMVELVSRVNAQIRRYTDYSVSEQEGIIRNGALEYDPTNQTVTKDGERLLLTPKETKLLSIFMKNVNRLYTKAQLYELVWNTDYIGDSNTIMVHISRIREQVESDPKSPVYITTVKGLGYRMEDHED
ncbi:response regulator transcription factor [Rossellomorea aquimaris]|uniref:response regulator transcription factor n=1 Tax=Rossellomorea aquimaris TaxID=189382 RepID=UPI001CD42C18|nr:response regulator transcription factor [Rossellomorea aquimaris]MCA1060323.1 response regulator transcription factor [Rossellomorea aquimaris]